MISMMKTAIAVVMCCFFSTGVWAMNWQELHTRAEELSLTEADAIVTNVSSSADELYTAALAYLNKYKNAEAESLFYRLRKEHPERYEAQWGIGECLRRKREYPAATKMFSEGIQKHPDFAPAYVSLAYIAYIATDFEETARLALRVIEMRKDNVDLPNYVRAYGLYAGAKGMIAHFGGPISKIVNGKAILPALKKAEKMSPGSQPVLFGLGSYYLLVPKVFGRDLILAEQYLLKALEVDPAFPDAYVRLAQVYKAQGKKELFNSTLQKALAIDPQNEIALDIKSGTCKFICVE